MLVRMSSTQMDGGTQGLPVLHLQGPEEVKAHRRQVPHITKRRAGPPSPHTPATWIFQVS